ncbi:restriction endonuclease subunit S [Clostridium thermarum]|uniref:restriction endonuclease subunit S n=1 Tax=Clostridium thermarum TaxID=1716543 RepID=UPI001121039D|nr:restriction endonuclease subunit S [Clostridium thermarum]
MSCNEWREVKLGEIIEFNPKESISKGKCAKKINMDMLKPFYKYINEYVMEEYKGGSKFRNGDTIMARITPCLENGKTAKVTLLDKNEVGFGSTEFIVLRAKEGLTTEDYVYYMAISPYVRDIAIKSMTGTSGRQRAQINVIQNININLPPLHEQKAIAKILSDLDEKIEINNRINKVLEEIAQTIFKRWFVDFEFPNENGEPYKSSGGEMIEGELGPIPKGWEVGRLRDIIEISSGKRPKDKSDYRTEQYQIPLIGASKIMGFTKEYLYNEPVMVIGRVGTHGVIQKFNEAIWPSDNTLVIKTKYYEFVYNILKNIDYISLNRGSTQPLITQTDIKNILILCPNNELLIE